jgi:hypothetical protein
MSSVAQANDQVPLSVLAQSLLDQSPSPSPRATMRGMEPITVRETRVEVSPVYRGKEHCHSGWSWWAAIFLFLIFAIAFYFLYFALRPSFVLNHCDESHSWSEDHGEGEINNGKLLGAAILSALVLIFLFLILMWLGWSN